MKRILLIITIVALPLFVVACAPPPSSNDIQRNRQEEMVQEGVAQVGVPSIKNFRELKLAKDIYELRDQTGLVTYTYLWNDFGGKLVFFCESIGYPIPYSTQFTASETMQTYNLKKSNKSERYYGIARLPQAEPNGLFSPSSAEGTWVMCKDPNGKDVRPVYAEPRVVVSQFKLQ